MSKNITKYVDGIKIVPVHFRRGVYNVWLADNMTGRDAVVFTTASRSKAIAVSEYLATLGRCLLVEMIDDKQGSQVAE